MGFTVSYIVNLPVSYSYFEGLLLIRFAGRKHVAYLILHFSHDGTRPC